MSVSPLIALLTLIPQAAGTVESVSLTGARPGEPLMVRVSYPEGPGPFPVIVWSHGDGFSKDDYQPLVGAWVRSGYVVVQPTHSDSLSLATPDEREVLARGESRRANNVADRSIDLLHVVERFTELEERAPAVKGRLDRTRVGLAGHSMGARAIQTLDARPDERLRALLLISPGGPMGPSNGKGRGIMVISGDNDRDRRSRQPAAWRRETYQSLSPGDRYLLWLSGAHHGFGGIVDDKPFINSGPVEPAQVGTIAAATTAFFDAYVKGSPAAKQALKDRKFRMPYPATLEMK